MTHKLSIATARSRHIARGWKNETMTWEELLQRFATPTETKETMEEYKAMAREKKTDCKDVGGFVGGWCTEGRRRVENILSRDLLTYDYDEFDKESLERIREALRGHAWCLYSTHSHTDEEWRVRIIIPVSRSITPDEFPAVARKVAEKLGMGGLDKGSFDLNRLMFWPSVAKNAPYMFHVGDTNGNFINPDVIKAEYENWTDASQWPLADDEKAADLFNPDFVEGTAMRAFSRKGNGGKLAEPAEKKGLIGAWCRTYDVKRAISRYLGTMYEPAPNGHYTHIGSSTSGNAKLVEGGKFIYSFHGTDPLQRKMMNSWDLVRLGLFRHEDERSKEGTRTDRLPSTKKMEELALKDPEVKARLMRESGNDFDIPEVPDYDAETTDEERVTDTLMGMLEVRKDGEVSVTAKNVYHILENDPNLQEKVRLDIFRNNIEILGELPWPTEGKYWLNRYNDCLLTYFDREYNMRKNTQIIERTFQDYLNRHSIHPVKEYLAGLPAWDGVKRLGGLFTDVLGAEDTEVNRKLSELIFTAAVRRIYEPGTKFDYCVILHGPEGVYKSTLLKMMAGEWFTDDVSSIEGKDSIEKLEGAWIVEISELTGLKKSELANQKAFISRTEDKIRPAYGRSVETRPRQCVIVGTTNEDFFLKGINDRNRRHPIVEIIPELRKITCTPVDYLLKWRDQLWAEAKVIEARKEPLYLGTKYEKAILEVQERHNMDLDDPMFSNLRDYLDWWLPADWESKTADDRRAIQLGDVHSQEDGLNVKIQRTRVTIPEIMEECMDIHRSNSQYKSVARQVGQYLKRIPGWKYGGSWRGPYGLQRTWVREEGATEDSEETKPWPSLFGTTEQEMSQSFSSSSYNILNDL